MGKGPRYRVAFRRRREGKTDYRMRKTMILSKIPRLVVRGSLKHMRVHIMEAHMTGDHTLVSAASWELTEKYGWRGYCGNIPAAYLTAFLLGHKALGLRMHRVTPDIGLWNSSAGARVFAVLKGAGDAGLHFKCGAEVIPQESRIKGEHITLYAEKLVEESPQLYKKTFSEYLLKNLNPEDLSNHFEEVKVKIETAFGRVNNRV